MAQAAMQEARRRGAGTFGWVVAALVRLPAQTGGGTFSVQRVAWANRCAPVRHAAVTADVFGVR